MLSPSSLGSYGLQALFILLMNGPLKASLISLIENWQTAEAAGISESDDSTPSVLSISEHTINIMIQWILWYNEYYEWIIADNEYYVGDCCWKANLNLNSFILLIIIAIFLSPVLKFLLISIDWVQWVHNCNHAITHLLILLIAMR